VQLNPSAEQAEQPFTLHLIQVELAAKVYPS